MGWLERMNGAINYIEDHITEEIDYEELSRIACCSVNNFQRMFTYITDITMSEYIRRRRLTLAAFELQNTKTRIIDIALKYGYESHEAFSRSFYKLHGIYPSKARKKGAVLKAYSRIAFQLSITGAAEIPYRIEEGRPFKVFGKSIELIYAKEDFYSDIEAFIKFSRNNGLIQRMREAAGYQPENEANTEVFGMAVYSLNESKKFKFMIFAEHPETAIPNDFEVLEIPKATWAILGTAYKQNEEIEAIQRIWKMLPEWFQTTGYAYSPGVLDFVKCLKKGNEYIAEIWVPIVSNLSDPEEG